MVGEVCFRTGVTAGGEQYLTQGHAEAEDERLRAEADILKLSTFNFAGLHG